MSMVVYVGLDVHLNSVAAVWGSAKSKPRSMTIAPTEEGFRRVKNGILALLRMHRIKRPEALKSAWTQKHVAWLKELAAGTALSSSVRTVLSSYVRELEFVEEEIKALQEAVEELAEDERYEGAVQRMTEMPGVGVLTALTFLLELGDLRRFNNRRQIGSYLGLVPASYESGEADDRKGHITRLGPPRVRKVLNQAAWHLVRLDPVWRKRYESIAYRGGGKTAIVAIMRRMGIEMWQRAKSA